MKLKQLGWNSFFEAAWNEPENSAGRRPARVIAQYRELWRVAGEFGETNVKATGKLRLDAENGADWPAVGDWVSVEGVAKTELRIAEVLRRRTQIVRKEAGRRMESQVLAANVDVVFLMMAMDGDFNLRRLERYVAQGWESGARPVILLNKVDLCPVTASRIAEVEKSASGVRVCAISALTGDGIEILSPDLCTGETVVLLGSSGVGKSSLTNRLLGAETQAVRAVRAEDSRGRHTTTARQLFLLPSGAMLIDTPGLRELRLWDAAEGLQQAFGDIDGLAAHCRFGNCAHRGEPGCAVKEAIERGRLSAERLENHRKLIREQDFLRRKIDPEAQQKTKRFIRSMNRAVRQLYQEREEKGKQ
jgi:ribosome biogenesis GTPase / thiamine phosphate phosphatase